jgi:sulfofructose kinase
MPGQIISGGQVVSAGIVALDDVYALTGPLRHGEKSRAATLQTVVGGNAANACLAISRLGGHARLVARLGADEAGASIRVWLEGEGVGMAFSRVVEGCRSSRSAIVIEPGGARTLFNYFDPAMPEEPDWLPPVLPAGTGAVLGDTRWEAGARHLFTLARAAGLPAVFDGDRRPVDGGLVTLATHAVFSAQGLREWTGENDLETGLKSFAGKAGGQSGHFVAVTDGAHGVYALAGGAIRHFPAYEIAAVDTLGAGDVWHGAFALALAEGMDEMRAIRFASAVAALKCLRPGGAVLAPSRAEVAAFMAERG